MKEEGVLNTTTGEGIREDCNFKRFSLIFIPADVTLLLPRLLLVRRVSFLMPGRMYLLVHTATGIGRGIALSESAFLTWSGYLNQVRMLRRAFSSPPPESHAENVYLGQSHGICLNLSEQTEGARVCECRVHRKSRVMFYTAATPSRGRCWWLWQAKNHSLQKH